MYKKFIAAMLFVSVLIGAAFAQTAPRTSDLASELRVSPSTRADAASSKSTMAEYERMKKSGKGLSTTTKVLIIGGIAAAVIAIVIVAGKNDLENNILR